MNSIKNRFSLIVFSNENTCFFLFAIGTKAEKRKTYHCIWHLKVFSLKQNNWAAAAVATQSQFILFQIVLDGFVMVTLSIANVCVREREIQWQEKKRQLASDNWWEFVLNIGILYRMNFCVWFSLSLVKFLFLWISFNRLSTSLND